MTENSFDLSDTIASALAVLALVVSIFSAYFTYKGMRLADRQEARRQPRLVPYLITGHVWRDREGTRATYAFHLTVSNPTDSDNAIASIELRLTYASRDGLIMTVKLPASTDPALHFMKGATALMPVPGAIGAHGTVAGWTYFPVPSTLLAGATVEGTLIGVIDSHGLIGTVEPIMVQEYRHEG